MGNVRVTINGRSLEVPEGVLVTEAARRAEVHVPIFCSHDKLPPLGACRICVVEMGTEKKGPDGAPLLDESGRPVVQWMPKPQTACTSRVAPGLHVRTDSPGAVKARKGVMEFLLVNHPLDCPVCDEGGECQLQDLAFAFGADFSRMADAKRTFESESLGPVVKKEANRCIVCMRCVRYCDEIMGDDALTAHQRGVWTEISSFNRQPLECEQCGNCIEVCPVGALTALPYRFKARPWDLRQHIGICPHCAAGCSVRLGVRGQELLRARGTEHRGVNAEYLCVRGRFGHEFVGAGERLGAPLVDLGQGLQPSHWDEAVAFASAQLREIAATHGGGSVAFLGGDKLALEEQYLFQKLARAVLGTPHVDARTRLSAPLPGAALLKATGGGRPLISFQELGRCQEVLVVGDDLQGENPFVQSVLIRGQHQAGLHLIQMHPRRVKLARGKFGGLWLHHRPGAELAVLQGITHLLAQAGAPELPAELAAGLAALSESLAPWTPDRVAREAGVERADLESAAVRLRQASRKAIVFGRAVMESSAAPALLQAVENLGWLCGALTAERSAVLYLGPQGNTQGAQDAGLAPDLLPGAVPVTDPAARAALEKAWGRPLPAGPGLAAPEILRAAAAGKIRALWIAGDHWLRSAPDRTLAEKALAGCDLVIVNELFLTETARAATVVFPVAAFAEKEGIYVNAERRVQKSARALNPRRGTRTDGDVFMAVAAALGAGWSYRGFEDVFRELVRVAPAYHGIRSAGLLPLGPQWPLDGAAPRVAASLSVPAAVDAPAAAAGEMWLATGAVLFQHGSLGQRSPLLGRLAGPARAWLHPAEAESLELREGDAVELSNESGRLVLPAGLDDGVPRGVVFVPYAYRDVELNRLGFPLPAGRRVRARRAATTPQEGPGAAVPR